jgi:hypothetical protein
LSEEGAHVAAAMTESATTPMLACSEPQLTTEAAMRELLRVLRMLVGRSVERAYHQHMR